MRGGSWVCSVTDLRKSEGGRSCEGSLWNMGVSWTISCLWSPFVYNPIAVWSLLALELLQRAVGSTKLHLNGAGPVLNEAAWSFSSFSCWAVETLSIELTSDSSENDSKLPTALSSVCSECCSSLCIKVEPESFDFPGDKWMSCDQHKNLKQFHLSNRAADLLVFKMSTSAFLLCCSHSLKQNKGVRVCVCRSVWVTSAIGGRESSLAGSRIWGCVNLCG